jgi:hypothetical protein
MNGCVGIAARADPISDAGRIDIRAWYDAAPFEGIMLTLRSGVAALSLLFAAGASAHPFLDVQPFPPATVSSGATYGMELVAFPGDTPIVTVQLDFELSSGAAFGPPSGTLGEGFTLVYDAVADPLHFSIVADFSDAPLEEFGVFPVAELNLEAGLPGETLKLLDSSAMVVLEGEELLVVERDGFSNVFGEGVMAQVMPEPSSSALLGAGVAALVGLRPRRRR